MTNTNLSMGASVELTFLRDDGPDVVRKFVGVPPGGRATVSVDRNQVPEISEGSFGVEIRSSQAISVERSMYWNANGEFWAAGTNAPGTPLPF